MTILLFDLSGQPHILLAVLRALGREPGTLVHLLAEHPLQPVRFSRHAASYTSVASAPEEERTLGQMQRLIRERRISVVLPSGVAATGFLSRYRPVLKDLCAIAPVPELEALELARDKGRLAVHLRMSTVPHPRSIIVTEPDEALRFFERLDGPALVKPLLSAGGRGILRIETKEALEAWLEAGRSAGHHLLEEYIPGHDIDCSILSDGGTILAHTVQRGILPGRTPYAAPAGIELLAHDGALESAAALASSLRWSGVAHIDMRLDERDGLVKVLEINPRFWRSLLGSVEAGVNFPSLACQHALGKRRAPSHFSSRRYIHENRIALRQMLRQHGRQKPYRFGETVLGESARDPLPELALLFIHSLLPQAREG